MFARLFLLTALVAAPLSAQDAAPAAASAQTESDILVEAPPTARERQLELKAMVSDLIRNPRVGRTVATFLEAPCPKVFGLPERAAKAIEARMLENARELELNRRNPRKNCKHNVSVIFVPESEGPASSWLDDETPALKHLLSFQRHRVINEEGPVRAFSRDFIRSADGARIPENNHRQLGQVGLNVNPVPYATRILVPIQVEIGGSAVMIEMAAARGKTSQQLAYYATMRALANLGGIDPETTPAAPTILTLFQDENPPEELTNFDRAFLSMLYSTNRRSSKNRYYSVIAARAANWEREAGLAPGSSASDE